jgi:hypothetical protein
VSGTPSLKGHIFDSCRPTQKRISTLGSRAPMAGRETIAGCPGPMAVDRDALEILMKVALSARPWRVDPSLTAKEWTPYSFTSRPKIAIQWVGLISIFSSTHVSALLTQETDGWRGEASPAYAPGVARGCSAMSSGRHGSRRLELRAA